MVRLFLCFLLVCFSCFFYLILSIPFYFIFDFFICILFEVPYFHCLSFLFLIGIYLSRSTLQTVPLHVPMSVLSTFHLSSTLINATNNTANIFINTVDTNTITNTMSKTYDYEYMLLRYGPFLPQLAILIVASLTLAPRNLPIYMLIQTYSFVIFNKVITAQYFTWFAILSLIAIPIPIPKYSTEYFDINNEKLKNEDRNINLNESKNENGLDINNVIQNTTNKITNSIMIKPYKDFAFLFNNFIILLSFHRNIIILLTIWTICLLIWLRQAYLLEFLGKNTFLYIWFASILFHIVNSYIIIFIITFSKTHKKKIRK